MPFSAAVCLSDILSAFKVAVNEEQCWSLAHQTLKAIRVHFRPRESALVSEPRHLLVGGDGEVDVRSFTDDSDCRSSANSENEMLAALAVVLFRALDYGLREDEEPSLSRPLERLIDRMSSAVVQDVDSRDEGIECEPKTALDDALEMCCARFASPEAAATHYRTVCRSLVSETRELTQFLETIERNESSSRTTNSKDDNDDESPPEFMTWARLWVHVIRQMRGGALLRSVETRGPEVAVEYELTPFEKLLNDIRFQNYRLKQIPKEDNKRTKRDAHQLILDFIRSRPTLVPAQQRELKPKPEKPESLYEKLMKSIRTDRPSLRPTPPPRSRTPPPVPSPAHEETASVPTKRRLIKADLNLRLSLTSLEDSDSEEDKKCPKTQENRKFSLKSLSLRLRSERRHSTPEELDANEDTRSHVAAVWQDCELAVKVQSLSLSLQEVRHIRSVLTRAEVETLAVTRSLRDDLESGRICFTCLKTRFSLFGFSSQRMCRICDRAVCDRCAVRMHIPVSQFEKVPIYMLSPTPSPPSETNSKHFPQNDRNDRKPQMDRKPESKSRLYRALTRESDAVVVDSGDRKSGPLVRVCRDCKRLVRHLVDAGSAAMNDVL
ncbi:protein spire-like [Oppia nitens]|uniref:protein spire-like n=1 Tax=Oppia nitens TaxID=1686743 RepID=UPI0023DC3DCE|nr:protein spire-like [Oppia nitens]